MNPWSVTPVLASSSVSTAHLVLVLVAFAMAIYSAISTWVLYFLLRKRIPGLNGGLVSIIGYVAISYWQRRRWIGSRGLDALALSSILAFGLAFALLWTL